MTTIGNRGALCLAAAALAIAAWISIAPRLRPLPPAPPNPVRLLNKKVLLIHSYHAEYEWSAGVAQGLRSVMAQHPGVRLNIHWMDTQRNKSEAFITAAAQAARAVIDQWQPDLVIASDDNAVKYLVEPFLNGSDLPVVFCGVNWNLDRYDLATDRNVTGIIEIAHYRQLIETLLPYAKGNRIGFLAGQNVNTDAEVSALKQEFPDYPVLTYAVRQFQEWKSELQKANGEVDILLVDNHAGISGWNPDEARQQVYDTVTIPTGSPNHWMTDYNMVTYAKNAEEQGEWAGRAALQILEGTAPSSIPVATAKKARIFLNMDLAKKLGIRFPMPLIENANLVSRHPVL